MRPRGLQNGSRPAPRCWRALWGSVDEGGRPTPATSPDGLAQPRGEPNPQPGPGFCATVMTVIYIKQQQQKAKRELEWDHPARVGTAPWQEASKMAAHPQGHSQLLHGA